MNVLAVGAHPDDIEIGCGGFLLKSTSIGHDVHILIITRGEASGDPYQRETEAKKAMEFMGARSLYFGNKKDTTLIPDGKLISVIEDVIEKVKPHLVLTHSTSDEHHDHRAVGFATIEAARYYPNILAYENPLTKEFRPEVFVDISDTIKRKVELLSLYKTQENKAYLKRNAIYGLASYRAFQSRLKGIKFAEAFQVMKFKLLDTPFLCQLPKMMKKCIKTNSFFL